MKWKQIVIGGIIIGFIIMLIDITLGRFIQFIWPYDIFELDGMRKVDDPITVLFFVHPWVLGFTVTTVYSYFEKSLDGNYITKGWKFGLLMWIVVFIPYSFLVYTSMDYPLGFTLNSVIPPLFYMLLSGIAIAKIFD